MNTIWIDLRSDDPAYIKGCKAFVELAKETLIEGKTQCPCNKCKLSKWFSVEVVGGHILFNGFYKRYRSWIFHSNDAQNSQTQRLSDPKKEANQSDMGGLLGAAFGVNITHSTSEPHDQSFCELGNEEEEVVHMNEETDFQNEVPFYNTTDEEARYKRLMAASNESLYEGCLIFSKLSFLLHLFHLKCMFHWSAESLDKLFELLIDAIPQIKEFSSSYYEGKKVIKDLGLGYEKIDAYPNDCMLYWGEFADKEECHICHSSRWKQIKGKEGDRGVKGKETCKVGESAKMMRYFPLIPRLKRLYMSSKTAESMRWHKEDQDRLNSSDNVLRHPVDALAWKEFDKRYPEFAEDSRSVRLGLASNGFNPYRLLNTNHSTWSVVLIPYNLPPSLCMKPSSFILSLIIPRKSGLGINIDVYFRPLIEELKLLWVGVDAFDVYSGNRFKMRAALHSTINDFPAYAMLSGWSTKGYKACPSCTYSTHSYKFGGNICYPMHQQWLPPDHPYRFQVELFDGTEEHRVNPIRASGTDILRQQEGIGYAYGK